MRHYSQKLRHRIQIQKPSTTQDAFGHRVDDWSLVAEVAADVRPVSVNERLVAFQMQSGQTHVVTIRHSATLENVTGEYRIIFQGRVFGIIGRPRNEGEKNRYLIIDTIEGYADGR